MKVQKGQDGGTFRYAIPELFFANIGIVRCFMHKKIEHMVPFFIALPYRF